MSLSLQVILKYRSTRNLLILSWLISGIKQAQRDKYLEQYPTRALSRGCFDYFVRACLSDSMTNGPMQHVDNNKRVHY